MCATCVIIDLYKISSETTIKQTYAAREIDSDLDTCNVFQSDKKMTKNKTSYTSSNIRSSII